MFFTSRRGCPARQANRLKNQELGIGQVVLYKIVRGRAQQPNLGRRTLSVESQVVLYKILEAVALVTNLLLRSTRSRVKFDLMIL